MKNDIDSIFFQSSGEQKNHFNMNPNILPAEAHDISLENEGLGSKLWRKSQNNPFLTVGM